MFTDFLLKVFEDHRESDAIVWKNQAYSYGWLLERIEHWRREVPADLVRPGCVTILKGDFSPNSIALLLTLIERNCILVPLTKATEASESEFIEIAQGQIMCSIDEQDQVDIQPLPYSGKHDIYDTLIESGRPGLVVFSSGSTGKSKAIVHDFSRILEKYKVRRPALKTITFLLYDHLGGINTMLHVLSNGGCLVTIEDRSPDGVLGAVERHRVELLPTSPTFFNLVLISGAYKRHDLSSLKIASYGTEAMPESTLKRFHEILPNVDLRQTYGLTELGVLRTKSEAPDSLWLRVGGEGFQTRVVDGILHIKADSAMLGYLNEESPFTEDGWFVTGDSVEVKGEFIKILGRETDIINVGGQKVYPAEVESVIQAMEEVAEVAVYGEKNPIVGNLVCATIRLLGDDDRRHFQAKLRRYCRDRLDDYKIPIKIKLSLEPLYTERFKRVR